MKIDQEYELVELNDDVDVLKPHPRNPNQGDDDVVEESVDVNGWYGAVIAQKSTGYVLAGHTRLRTAIKKNASHVPVIWKDVDDETALRILLVDNESARRAIMDYDVVGQILDQLGDIRGTGIRKGETPADSVEVAQEDAAVDTALEVVEADEEAESTLPEAADVPDDVYMPQYGVMLVVDTEEQQAALYEWLQAPLIDESEPDEIRVILGQAKLRVIAV